MKTKKFFIMLAMMVWVNGMFAQTENEIESQDSTEAPSAPEVEQQAPETPKTDNFEELVKLLREFNSQAIAEQQLDKQDYSKMYKPVQGKSWLSRHFDITQQISVSMSAGSDKDEDPDDEHDLDNYADDIKSGNTDDSHSTNVGFHAEYTRSYQWGTLEGDSLRLNRFGGAISFGLLFSADKQEKYGTTWDALAKIGIEMGKGHIMGVGLDFLFGVGTSAVASVFEDMGPDGNDLYGYDTHFGKKWGFRPWIRTGLLHTSIKNTDVRLFFEYVYSPDPTDDRDFIDPENGKSIGYYLWSPESIRIGLVFCYEF